MTDLLPRSGFHVVRRGENDGKEKEDVINRGQVGSADPPPQPGWPGLVSVPKFAEKPLSGWSSTAVFGKSEVLDGPFRS